MQMYSIYLALNDSMLASEIIRILKGIGIEKILLFTSQEVLFKQAMADFPSLIITDLYEDNAVNNFDLAEKLWNHKNIPFVFLSNLNLEQFRKVYTSCKYTFVKTPVRENELIRDVNELLNGSKMGMPQDARTSDYSPS